MNKRELGIAMIAINLFLGVLCLATGHIALGIFDLSIAGLIYSIIPKRKE